MLASSSGPDVAKQAQTMILPTGFSSRNPVRTVRYLFILNYFVKCLCILKQKLWQ